jgi:uncharacterized membrane protein
LLAGGGMRRTRFAISAVLFGVGLGGFLDGIVFHQILQWHSMLSTRVPPYTVDAMHENMRADGWFHLAMWITTLAAVFWLLSAFRAPGRTPSVRSFVGNMLVGWGGFNIAEGVIDHFVLELHHVRDLPLYVAFYDWVFLTAAGIGALLVGMALRDAPDPGPVAEERRSGGERRLRMS